MMFNLIRKITDIETPRGFKIVQKSLQMKAEF